MARRTRKKSSRRFYVAVAVAAGLATTFAVGFRIGQQMPAPIASYFEAEHSDGSDHRQPIVAPEQRIPLDTFTFYDSVEGQSAAPATRSRDERVLDRQEVAVDPAADLSRTLPREPSEPSAENEPPRSPQLERAVRPPPSAVADVVEQAEVVEEVEVPVPDAEEAPFDPSSVRRVAVVVRPE